MSKRQVRMDIIKVGDKFMFNGANYELMSIISEHGLSYPYEAQIVGYDSSQRFADDTMVTPLKTKKQLVRLDSIPVGERLKSKDGTKGTVKKTTMKFGGNEKGNDIPTFVTVLWDAYPESNILGDVLVYPLSKKGGKESQYVKISTVNIDERVLTDDGKTGEVIWSDVIEVQIMDKDKNVTHHVPDELVRVISKGKKKARIRELERDNATIERKWRALIADCDKYQELSERPHVPDGHVTIEASALKGMLDESFDAKKRESDIFLLHSELADARQELAYLREVSPKNNDANIAMIDLLEKIATIINMPVGKSFNQTPQYIKTLLQERQTAVDNHDTCLSVINDIATLLSAPVCENLLDELPKVVKQLTAANKLQRQTIDSYFEWVERISKILKCHSGCPSIEVAIKELINSSRNAANAAANMETHVDAVIKQDLKRKYDERGERIEKLTAENKRLTNLLQPSYLADSAWVKIDGVESLPKVDCGLWVIIKWNNTMSRFSFVAEIDSNFLIEQCAHYQIIKKPLPPSVK